MNCVLSHARNAPSVSTHPLTCPTTYYCLDWRQNAAFKWFSDLGVAGGGSRPRHFISLCLQFIFRHYEKKKKHTFAPIEQINRKTDWSKHSCIFYLFYFFVHCPLHFQCSINTVWRVERKDPKGKRIQNPIQIISLLNRNEKLRFAEPLKSDWTWPSLTESSCCRSLKSCVGSDSRINGPSADSLFTLGSCRRSRVPNTGELSEGRILLERVVFELVSTTLDLCFKHTCSEEFFFFSSEKHLQIVGLAGSWCQTLGSFEFRHPIKKKRKKKGNSQPRFNHTGCLVG